MLCLASSSACDICYESFDNSLRVPSAIECGHVFCTTCLTQIRIITCPLCRAPFNPLRAIKLFGIDLNNTSAGPSYSEARRIRKAIGDVMKGGIREAQLRQLVAECKSFIQSHHGQKDSEDLQNSCRMLAHLCEVQTKANESEQLISSLKADIAKLHVSENDVRRNLNDAHGSIIDLMKKSNAQKEEIERLRKELARWSSNQGSPPHDLQRHFGQHQDQSRRSSFRSLTPSDDQRRTISPLPDFTSNLLLQNLPEVEEGEAMGSGEELDARTPGSREAAGYLLSGYDVLGGPTSPPQITPSYTSEGTLPLLNDTPLDLPIEALGLLSMTPPKAESSGSSHLLAYPSQSPSQMLHALLTDDRPVCPSSLPVSSDGVTLFSSQAGVQQKKDKKKRDKKRNRAENVEVDARFLELPFSFPSREHVAGQEAALKSPIHWESPPPTRRQSVPVNSALFSHAPPEACQSFNSSSGVKSPRRHSESKDQWRGYQHQQYVYGSGISCPSDFIDARHYNDRSDRMPSGFPFI